MQKNSYSIGVVIVAAGVGSRAGAGERKVYRRVNGHPVLAHSLRTFLEHPSITNVVVVVHPDDHELYSGIAPTHPKLLRCVEGGDTRQSSVRLGLESLTSISPDYVLVHDAARPFVSSSLIDLVLAELVGGKSAVFPSLVPTDATKRVDSSGVVTDDLDRSSIALSQTPQGFLYKDILAAHLSALESSELNFVDDCSVALWSGMTVRSVSGDVDNKKLTYESDFVYADSMNNFSNMNNFANMTNFFVRVGHGYDVHAFDDTDNTTTQKFVRLCGVDVPHTRGLVGHSDSDVGLHALVDALLATISAGDIGVHFPPDSAEWKDKDSGFFVEHTRDLITNVGGKIVHCDITLVCESPKITPYRDSMRERIADLLNIDISCVSVKATTSEGLGFVGEGLGICAYSTATVEVPRDG